LNKFNNHILKFKDFKHWKIKDTYYFKKETGTHWFLKKYIVLYKNILVTKNKINKVTLEDIKNIFEIFCNSIKNPLERDRAYNFFFNPVDLRKPDSIVNFDHFNNVPAKEDAARKFFMMKILGGGGQSGVKKNIWGLMDQKLSLKEIIEQIPSIRKFSIKKKQEDGKLPRSVNDKVNTIIADIPAQIRNYRQVFTYWGFCPHEEDGYELNQISNLIYNCNDSELLAALGDHQKFKMRIGNPLLPNLVSKKIDKEFNSIEDFYDFEVNPAIALIEILEKLLEKNINYFTLDEYILIISRLAPFNLLKAVELIIENRNSTNENVKATKYLSREKLRGFRNTKISKSENFLKELQNLIYGQNFKKTDESLNANAFIEYKNGRLIITDKEKFKYYSNFIKNIKNYLTENYSNFYDECSKSYILSMLRDIASSLNITDTSKNKIIKIRKSIIDDKDLKVYDFYKNIESKWKKYLTTVDYDLIILCYSLNLALNNYNHILNNLSEFKKNYKLPLFFKNTSENVCDKIFYLLEVFKNRSLKIPKDFFTNLQVKNIDENLYNDLNDLSGSSYSVIVRSIEKENIDKLTFEKNQLIPVRNLKMMNFIRTQRMKNIYFGKKTDLYNPNNCDVCNVESKLECHHIIPFEIGGPDVDLNYSFLCSACHKLFTHKTNKEVKIAINTLRLKNLFNINNLSRLINEGKLKKNHLDFLFHHQYIHLVEYLELTKLLNFNKKDFMDDIFIKTKLGPSSERWNRAMKTTYFFRKEYNYIMKEQRFDYDISKCDGGCGSVLKENNLECHHIIPKKLKLERHNFQGLEGPESPFNYAFLCKECHKFFTFDKKEQHGIINNFRKNQLLSEENVKKMIISDNIDLEHLKFLHKDNYINQNEFNNLQQDLKTRDFYRSI
jgi:5-methylcytosine-specific restriction endonuclease McrA